MTKANKSIIQKLCVIAAVSSALLLTGCLGGGGGGGGGNGHRNDPIPVYDSGFYDSKKTSVTNLADIGNRLSLYNGQSSVEIKNIPVDENRNVLYAALITNLDTFKPINNLTFGTPYNYNARAAVAEDKESDSDVSPWLENVEFRENPSAKLQLQQELMRMYEAQEISNARSSIRAAISHIDEKEGQKGIPITVLGKSRKCTLAKVSKHAKFFADEDGDGDVLKPDISSAKFDEFADEFDNLIYPVLKENFGDDEGSNIFWNDVDGDGRLSIVFSPVVNHYQTNVAGIFDSSNINSKNPRDMVALACNKEPSKFDKWFMDARETIAHEMQHIVNFSAKGNRSESELWIDEGLAVCAEMLYRIRRSNLGLSTYSLYYDGVHADFPGNDARLYCYAYCLPEISIQSFGKTLTNTDTELLAHYGQKGLFFYYLYEQYGKDVIRKLCRGEGGTEKFSRIIADRSLGQLIIDFNFATLYEKLRNVKLSKFPTNPYYSANVQHRFITNMNLNFKKNKSGSYYETTEKDIGFNNLGDYSKKTLSIVDSTKSSTSIVDAYGGTVRILLLQPAEMRSALSGERSYSISFHSTSNIPLVVNMIRMNN